jgi:uncharacterized protein YdaU (DUF1376 family)
MVAFYKHDIAAWRGGTASLSSDQYRVYHIIIEQMMIDEGPIQVHERMLAGLSNMSVRAFRKALEELISMGKLVRNVGEISNFRVENELKSIRNNRENAKTGGVSSGKSRRNDNFEDKKDNDFNEESEAPLRSGSKPKREEIDIEKRREEIESPLPSEGPPTPVLGDDEKPRQRAKPVAPASRGSRLSEDWSPNEDDMRTALNEGMSRREIMREADRFRDYWLAKSGKDATKTDWSATWRNWVRRAADDRGLSGRQRSVTKVAI